MCKQEVQQQSSFQRMGTNVSTEAFTYRKKLTWANVAAFVCVCVCIQCTYIHATVRSRGVFFFFACGMLRCVYFMHMSPPDEIILKKAHLAPSSFWIKWFERSILTSSSSFLIACDWDHYRTTQEHLYLNCPKLKSLFNTFPLTAERV